MENPERYEEGLKGALGALLKAEAAADLIGDTVARATALRQIAEEYVRLAQAARH